MGESLTGAGTRTGLNRGIATALQLTAATIGPGPVGEGDGQTPSTTPSPTAAGQRPGPAGQLEAGRVPLALGIATGHCGRSSVAELQLPKLIARVRFSSPAPSRQTRPDQGIRGNGRISQTRECTCIRRLVELVTNKTDPCVDRQHRGAVDAPPLIFPMYSAPGFVKRRGALDAAAGGRR